MHPKARVAAAGLALTWLVACGSSIPDQATDQQDAAPAPDAKARQGTKDETVFDDLIRTEDKARSVEGTVMKSKANTDAAIEAAAGGDAQPEPDSSNQ